MPKHLDNRRECAESSTDTKQHIEKTQQDMHRTTKDTITEEDQTIHSDVDPLKVKGRIS